MGCSWAAAQSPNRYALVLEDPAPAARFPSREGTRTAQAAAYGAQIATRQAALRTALATRGIRVTGSVSMIANAVFVAATPDRLAELRALPGVKGVVRLRRYHANLNQATQLIDAQGAWTAAGGIENSGTGIKIAILDSGIDQTNPALRDDTIPLPPGFPLCTPGDCAFTNNKVIVARSYVRQLAAGSADNPASDSHPDDYSARDREGHGTAVASVAAGQVTRAGAITFSGVAPKAYLGNYKIYGSPEVNDFTTDDVILAALEDAFNDGMDVVSFSTGGVAFTGPLDAGAVCGNDPDVPCDLLGQTFETVAAKGLVIVAAAGNEGGDGNFYPSFNTIATPGDAPSVIAAGATTNAHYFTEALSVAGDDPPPNLVRLAIQPGDSYVPTGGWTFPLVDVTLLGDDGYACSPLPAASLAQSIALIERGPAGSLCTFSTKMLNAVDAGAVGVVFYMYDSTALFSPGGLSGFGVPAGLISNSDGLALKAYAALHPGVRVTFDGTAIEESDAPNRLAGFSSFGPSAGSSALKPDLVATGTSVFMAAQSYDPLGLLYSSSGFAAAAGTSFATPLVSGAAALVKQQHPDFTAADVRSALINTATQDVTFDDSGDLVTIQWLGAGKLDVGAAVRTTLTANPPTVSFGAISAGVLPKNASITIVNHGAGAVNLTAAIAPAQQGVGAGLSLNQQSFTVPAGQSTTLTLTLFGTAPSPGSYSGYVVVEGGSTPLHIPYLYLVGTGVAANIIPLTGTNFDGTVGEDIPEGFVSFKLVDLYGLPVAGAPVAFSSSAGASLGNADAVTDMFGIAGAEARLGPSPGMYSFTAVAGGQRLRFSGFARTRPVLAANGVVNAASIDPTQAVAAGSYISLFGAGLSDFTDYPVSASPLPLAIDYVNVSFDVPAAHLSVPGHLTFASPGQVNVQVPWELEGQAAAQVKVSIGDSLGNVLSVPLAVYSPAFFEIGAGTVAARDAANRVVDAENPAPRGQVVQLYVNGLGPVSNQPASGDPAPASPLAQTTTTPVVMIGGRQAAVQFSGLAPGFAGLYQVNVTVPPELAPGTHPISIAIGGLTSKASGIAVR